MDSQLYVWARKQEVQRELARRALVSEAKAVRAQGNARRGDVMLETRTTRPTTEDKIQQEPAISASTAGVQENKNGRAWRWRVEPGMEDAFQDLLGWMLPSQRGAEVETVSSPPEPSAPATVERLPAAPPTALKTSECRPASDLRPLPA